jgi:polysaccharide export outer membrane protein
MSRFATILVSILLITLCPVIGQEGTDTGGSVNGAEFPSSVPALNGGSLTPLSSETHILRPGDRLELNIAALPEIPRIYDVRVDGHFYHPLVGEISAAGKTLGDLRALLEERLAKELRNPSFRLGIIQVARHQVAVLGEAQRQGTFMVGVGASVLDVIAAAGGLSNKADSKRAVLLRGEEKVEVSLEPEEGGGLTKVRSGDILYILPGSPVSVTGEVTTPGIYSVSRVGGSPRKALLAAGGAREQASLSRVRLIRATLPEPIIMDLTPGTTEPLPEPARQLQEGDILVVPARQAVLLGAVSQPGPVPLVGDETLVDILPARVGQGSDIRKVMVIRAEDVRKSRERNEVYNLEEYLKEGNAEIAVPIYDGDVVYVPPRKQGGGFFRNVLPVLNVIQLARWFI